MRLIHNFQLRPELIIGILALVLPITGVAVASSGGSYKVQAAAITNASVSKQIKAFFDKNKKKSSLAALLFFIRTRKTVSALLLLMALAMFMFVGPSSRGT